MKYCLKDECVRVWVEKTKEKAWKEKKQKMQQELETVQDYIKMTQIIFNKYIRLRDKGQVCISCNKPALKENAGHFWSAGGHSNVRFNEDNVHLQCEYCNTYLSGNLIMYNNNLLYKLGSDRFIKLHEQAHITKKWTKDELIEIIKEYKLKIKQYETN
jgi:hypothetical protein